MRCLAGCVLRFIIVGDEDDIDVLDARVRRQPGPRGAAGSFVGRVEYGSEMAVAADTEVERVVITQVSDRRFTSDRVGLEQDS